MAGSVKGGWAGMIIAALLVTGCSSDQLGDRGGQDGAAPDRIGDVDHVEVFRNADQFPNIARICIEGVAFAATSSGLRGEDGVANPALIRIPEWDAKCPGHVAGPSPQPAAPSPN
jgi:hypothetical protein